MEFWGFRIMITAMEQNNNNGNEEGRNNGNFSDRFIVVYNSTNISAEQVINLLK